MEETVSKDWGERFRADRPKYYDFTKEVDDLLHKILAGNSIDYVNIEARTKSVGSFCEKISRDGKSYADPLRQITDLSACRVICYYNSDIDRIDELLRKNFKVLDEYSEKKDKKENPREFGYLSRHLVVEFGAERLKFDEYKRFRTLRAEIQVRTALQHAWAAIEHKLQYKNQSEVPEPLQRKLFQISALLELADDEFEFLQKKLGVLRKEYQDEIESGEQELPINVESVDVYLLTSNAIEGVKSSLWKYGYSMAPQHPSARNPLSKLVETLQVVGIGSVSDLDKQLFEGKTKGFWTEQFDKLFKTWKTPEMPNKLVLDPVGVVRIMLILASKKTVAEKALRRVLFGESLNAALKSMMVE